MGWGGHRQSPVPSTHYRHSGVTATPPLPLLLGQQPLCCEGSLCWGRSRMWTGSIVVQAGTGRSCTALDEPP